MSAELLITRARPLEAPVTERPARAAARYEAAETTVVARVRTRRRSPRLQRTARERLMVPYPGVVSRALRWVDRLPVRSRLRRRLLLQACRSGWEAVSRGDFELLFLLYHPDSVYQTEMPSELRLPDSPRGGYFRGQEAIRRYMENFLASWSAVHFQLREVFMLDGGGRILCLGQLHARGLSSGIEVDIPIATLVDIEGGVNVRQQDYWDHGDALRAVGLDPGDYADAGT